jgi:hypothetical protein
MSNSRTEVPFKWLRLAGTACLLLLSCASSPVSGDAKFGGSPIPRAATGAIGDRNGVYVGTADAEINGSFSCPTPMSVTGFRVDGNVMRFGGFRATIADNGSVGETVFRGMWLTGQFDGPTFHGHINAFGDTTGQLNACAYAITATRQTA